MDPNTSTPSGRPTKAAINAAIRTHMDVQETLVGYRQLRALGLDPEAIDRKIDANELFLRTRWRPVETETTDEHGNTTRRRRPRTQAGGAYSASEAPLSLDGLYWSAILAAPPGCWITGAAGCALLDLERFRGGPIQVVHLGGGWNPPAGVTSIRTKHLPDGDRTSVRGIPCAAPARAVFDGASDKRVSDDRIDGWLGRAIELRIYDEVAMRRTISDRRKLRGATRLDAALGRLDELSEEFRSLFEQKVTRLVQSSRLIPAPVVNILLDGFRPDLHFLRTRVIIECDGRDYHRSMAQIVADEKREKILRQRGFVFLRLRWADVQYRPEATLARIEQFVLANLQPAEPLAV